MRTWRAAILIGAVATALLRGPAGPAAAAPAPAGQPSHRVDPGRQTLPANDGWAAFSTGTTGGSAAAPEQVFTVTNRAELIAALGGSGNAAPKIIYVRGAIDANVSDTGQPLSCADYATGGYSLEAYLAAYDPAVWGRDTEPAGPLEDARVASTRRQGERMQIRIPSNTTLVGLGRNARLLGANLVLNRADNVIIRNLTFEDAFDCFPQWDPTDGTNGAWNSLYDNVSLFESTHVWVDHNTFTDGRNPDSGLPRFFGQIFQQHDGELDITRASDLVTASWNRFTNHGKTMLIGSSNTAVADRGKLRVTVHHNLFQTVQERAPRVRFGQVHVYNNLYLTPAGAGFSYSWGVGVESALFAERNFILLETGVTAAQVIFHWGGTAITARNNLVNGRPVDVLAAFNAANPATPLGADAGWTPTLFPRLDPTWAVPILVGIGAGAGHLG